MTQLLSSIPLVLLGALISTTVVFGMDTLDQMKQTEEESTLNVAMVVESLIAGDIDFQGSYSDPNHPNCKREIVLLDGKGNANVSGTDGNPGCPPDGSGKEWSLMGEIDGDAILVDFSPKGGPPDLKGAWEPSPISGIRWPDGNLWAKN